jgi:dTDP-4-amino-4,6-dideoxygalactose transaminase
LGAVRAAGMNPIVLDIDVEDWTLSVPLLAAALAGTRDAVVMLTAPFGLNRSFSAHLALCKYYGAPVVIDNAAGLGPPRLATKPDSRVFEVFSMHATKPFGIGEGCAVFACADHDADLREALSFALGTYGHSETVSWGFNGKMSEMHAAVGLAQLDRFQGRMERRQAFAAEYLRRLAPLPGLTCRYAMSDSPWQFFPILLPNTQTTERFIERAGSVGVEIRRYYRPSLSRWPEAKCGSPCPVSEDLADRMCALPIRAAQGRADIDVIVNLIEAALRETLFNVCGREA